MFEKIPRRPKILAAVLGDGAKSRQKIVKIHVAFKVCKSFET